MFLLSLFCANAVLGLQFTSWKTGYVNNWDSRLHLEPGHGKIITGIADSVHSNHREDRRFKFYVTNAAPGMTCVPGHWTDWQNGWDGNLNYKCPDHHALNAVYSEHHNKHEDRRFKFKCCDVRSGGKFTIAPARLSSYINHLDGRGDGKCNSDSVLVGLNSYHSNRHEDRRWRLYCGVVQEKTLPPPPPPPPVDPRKLAYNQIRQKSSHNSYKRSEPLIDQLQYHRIRSLELDIYKSKPRHRTIKGQWFVYHFYPFDVQTTCHRLQDCLQEFKAWHDANPQHEVVTVWIDLKDSKMSPGWDRPALDNRLRSSGLPLFTAANLRGSAETLQKAVAGGWPAIDELQGKFIFVLTDKSAQYCNSNADCNNAAAFRHCDASSSKPVSGSPGFCVFFNQRCDGDSGNQIENIYKAGYVSRCYRSDDVNTGAEWNDAARKMTNHIATDKINFHKDPQIASHNKFGWPFEAIDGTDVSQQRPNTRSIGISINSGDIWSKYDDFGFDYKPEERTGQWHEYTVMVNNANSHVDEWAKGGIMVRDDINTKNHGESSQYFAVLRAADNKKLRVQYRTCYKCDTHGKDVDIKPYGNVIDQENRCFLKLRVLLGPSSSSVEGYGSQDGKDWTLIHKQDFSKKMIFHGLAASSHNDNGNDDGTKIKHLFTNFLKNGKPVEASSLIQLNVGNDVSSHQKYSGLFPA